MKTLKKPSLSALCVPLLFPSCHLTTPTKKIPVVLVHGIFDDGDSFGPLRIRLRQAGYKCLAPDLSPSNGKEGILVLTQQLERYIKEELGEKQPYHLVGYSMGGIVARSYLRGSENRASCLSLTTLATPHHGTQLAKLYPLKAGVELRPKSAYLTSLNADVKSYHPNTLSVRTTLDGVIIPSASSTLKGAKNLTFSTPAHPSLLVSKRVAAKVLNHLEKHELAQLAH